MRNHLKQFMMSMVVIGLLVGIGSASAATVRVTPGGPMTGTSGATQFRFSTVARTINCASTSFTARYVSGTFTGVTLPFAISTNVQPRFSACTLTGGLTLSAPCTNTAVLSATGLRATPMTLTAFACTFAVGATCAVRISGSLSGDHDNTTGTIRIFTTGQSLAASGSTNGSGGTCTALPNDPSIAFSNSTGGTVIYTESPAQRIDVS